MEQDNLVDMLPRYQWVRWKLESYLSGLAIGDKIISENELVKEYKVSRVTARKALQLLRSNGTIKCVRGRGTFLAKMPTRVDSPKAPKAKLLGVVVPSVDAPLIGEVVHGIEAEATKHGYHLVLSHDHNDPQLQISQLRKMLDTDVSGILLYPDRFVTDCKEFLELLEEWKTRNVPLVLLDRYIAELDFTCVMTDNIQGMYELTEHLICCGRRRPALIGFWESNTVHMARRKGFLEALREHRLPTKSLIEEHVSSTKLSSHTGNDILHEWIEAGHDIVAKWVKGKTVAELPFDSIVCMFDAIAYGAFNALQEAGIRVPEDIALVGYDNLDAGLYRTQGLQLTSVQQPLDLEGATAVNILIDRIENKPRASRRNHVLLPPKLVVRTSCGAKLVNAPAGIPVA